MLGEEEIDFCDICHDSLEICECDDLDQQSQFNKIKYDKE